jgi:tetratricopeptide (TPR) repeat protein
MPIRYRATLYAQKSFLECAKQEFDKALTDLDMAMKLEPGARHRWAQKAYVLIGLGKLSAAETVCSEGLQMEAAGGGYRHRADYLRTLGRLDQAIEDYTKAIELERKEHYYTLYIRGLSYFRSGKFLQSRSDLKLAAKMNPSSGKALSLLGAVEDELGKTKESQACFTRAFALSTHSPIMFVNRATAELHQSKLESAMSDVNQAIEMDPYFKEAYALRAQIAKKQGRAQDAAKDELTAQKLLTHLY